jgi:hypothetical protein
MKNTKFSFTSEVANLGFSLKTLRPQYIDLINRMVATAPANIEAYDVTVPSEGDQVSVLTVQLGEVVVDSPVAEATFTIPIDELCVDDLAALAEAVAKTL